jgi:hypothetical protein
VLALDCLGAHEQRLPITVAMTMGMVMRPIPGHLRPAFGIGAIPIKGITLRCPNARCRGNQLSSDDPDLLRLEPEAPAGLALAGTHSPRDLHFTRPINLETEFEKRAKKLVAQ